MDVQLHRQDCESVFPGEVFAESDEDGSGTLNKASAGDFKTW